MLPVQLRRPLPMAEYPTTLKLTQLGGDGVGTAGHNERASVAGRISSELARSRHFVGKPPGKGRSQS